MLSVREKIIICLLLLSSAWVQAADAPQADNNFLMEQQLQKLRQEELAQIKAQNKTAQANNQQIYKNSPYTPPVTPPPAATSSASPAAPAAAAAAAGTPIATGPGNVASETATPPQQVNDAAFNHMATNLLPMTPEQIQRLRTLFNVTQYASSMPVGVPPRPVATSLTANLAPGATPPVIRLQQGFVSSMVFLDETGAPWPIESYDVGNPQAFNIQWDKKSNTLLVQSTTLYTYGNLAVKLVGLNTPVMLTLFPGQKAVDYRADIHVMGLGPDAKALPSQGLPANETELLYTVLGGGAPQTRGITAKTLTVTGADAMAWVLAGKMFLRTPLTVLSPGWLAMVSSADGTNAYEMKPTPVVLVSDHGKTVSLRIGGF